MTLPLPSKLVPVTLGGFSAQNLLVSGCSSWSRVGRRFVTVWGKLFAVAPPPETAAEVVVPADGLAVHLDGAPHRVLEKGSPFGSWDWRGSGPTQSFPEVRDVGASSNCMGVIPERAEFVLPTLPHCFAEVSFKDVEVVFNIQLHCHHSASQKHENQFDSHVLVRRGHSGRYGGGGSSPGGVARPARVRLPPRPLSVQWRQNTLLAALISTSCRATTLVIILRAWSAIITAADSSPTKIDPLFTNPTASIMSRVQ